eukprot:jgi/Galph1/3872/GphlegSOOS_G2562.1
MIARGKNLFGQLLDKVEENNSQFLDWTHLPVPSSLKFPLRKLDSTWSSTFLIDDDGDVFYRGRYFYEDWRLETDKTTEVSKKRKLGGPSWRRLPESTACLTKNASTLSVSDDLLAIVSHEKNQLVVYLGNENSTSPSWSNFKVFNSPCEGKGFDSIATGRSYLLTILSNGDVYGWGTNDYGQLGIHFQQDDTVEITKSFVETLVVIPSIPFGMAAKVVCSELSSAVLTKDGNVYVFGNNLYLQLGTDVCCPVQVPRRINVRSTQPVMDIALNGWQLAVVFESGEIWISGKEPIHPLYCGRRSSTIETQYWLSIPPDERIVAVYGGKRYFLLLTDTDKPFMECKYFWKMGFHQAHDNMYREPHYHLP